jgi:O-antigen/teichoic acid export membrane protein
MSTNARKLASGSALRVGNVVATGVVSLLMMPFIVHSLGDRMYGIWALVASIVGYYGLLEFGLSQAINRYLASALGAGDEEDCNRVFNTSFRIYLALGLVALMVTGLVASLAPWFCKSQEDASLAWKVLLILGLSMAVGFPTRVFKGILEANLRFDRTAGLEILALFLRSALVIVVLLRGYKVVGLAWATLSTSVLLSISYVYYSFRDLPFLRFDSRYWERNTAKRLFTYSTYSFISYIADIVRFQLDSVVVATIVGLAAVTHYVIAGRLVQYFVGIILALLGVFLSVFSRQEGAKDYDAIRKTLWFASKVAVCASSFIGFGLIAWGKPFIARWMGPQYSDSYPCLVALALGLTLDLWQAPSCYLLYGTSRHKFLAFSSSLEGIANLLLSILLARRYGILGVALGTMLPIVVSKFLVLPVYACRVAGIAYSEYVRKAAKLLAAVAGSLVVPTLLTIKFAEPTYKSLMLTATLSLLAYALPLWFFVFTPLETQMLRRAALPGFLVAKKAG